LTGGGTDPDGETLSYQWTQTAGPPVSITSPQTLSAFFMAPDVSADTVLTFLLKVTDSQGLSSEDSVSVTVTAVQEPGPGDGDGDSSDGCGCGASSSSATALMPLLMLVMVYMSRRRRSRC
jgi:uncharacterized protein (TIGR03382 family)